MAVEFCKARLALLEAQLAMLDKAIKTSTTAQSVVHDQVELLCSVPGMGRLTACVLLSETGHLATMDSSRPWAAFAGLSPVPRQSGAMIGKACISRIGNARLRRGLSLSALTGSRLHNPLGDFYRRLVAARKQGKVALSALARKLLRVCFAVLKSARPFDAAYRRPARTA